MESSIFATIAFIERMRLLSLIAGRKHVLIKKYALNKHVRLSTRLYSISRGVSPNPEKVEKVKYYPVPTNPTEVRQFLGLASYYRRSMKDFAKIAKPAKPLYSPTCKDVTFEWSRACHNAFEALKSLLVTAPVLAYPRFGEGLICLDTRLYCIQIMQRVHHFLTVVIHHRSLRGGQ